MKALIVSEPGVDGVFRYVEMLCRFLSDAGVQVHLAYSDRRGSDRLHDLVRWVEARGGRTLNLRVSNRPEVGDVRAWRTLRRLVREVRPDVIHSHSSKAGFLARILRCHGCRAAQVYHPHAYVGMRPIPGRLDRLYNAIEACLGRLSTTVVVSKGEMNFARRRLRVPPGRLRMVPNGVDVQRCAPPDNRVRRAVRSSLGVPADAAVLGFMARSCAQKDPLTLYQAWARVNEASPVWLLHVGTGELDGELAAFVAARGLGDRVRRCSYLTDPTEFYRAVDGFVLTSRYEGLSLAALEALAANLPMILSAVPGNEDLLDLPLTHCWSGEPGDVAGFAAAIQQWHAGLGVGTAPNHRAVARECFDLQTNFGAVLELYYDLTGEAAARELPARGSTRAPDGGEPRVFPPRGQANAGGMRRPPAGARRS